MPARPGIGVMPIGPGIGVMPIGPGIGVMPTGPGIGRTVRENPLAGGMLAGRATPVPVRWPATAALGRAAYGVARAVPGGPAAAPAAARSRTTSNASASCAPQ